MDSILDAAIRYQHECSRRRAAVAALQARHPRPQEAIRAQVARLRTIPPDRVLGPVHRGQLLQAIDDLESVADWLDQGGFRPVEMRHGGHVLRDQW